MIKTEKHRRPMDADVFTVFDQSLRSRLPGDRKEKAEDPLRPNQKFATSEDFSCSWSLSAIRAINSEFVGFPLVLLTV